jgi:uncharacterized protein
MMASVAAGVDNNLVPVAREGRIQALDVIRGVSILGVLAVNADGFAAPISSSLNPATWPFPNEGWTAISYWFMDAFFHDKFITIFSMLFGVSLYLVGGERSDKNKGRILWRRLAVLFAFAMLHGFGIWWGDILSLYAVTGVVMVFCRSWSPRTLLVIGVVLYAVMGLRQLAPAVLPSGSPAARPPAVAHRVADTAATAKRQSEVARTIAEAKSSWTGAYRANTRAYLRVTSGYPWLVPSTLGLMMIGLSLFKSGFFAGRSSARRYGVVIATGAVALGVIAWLTWKQDVLALPVRGGEAMQLLLAPFVSLAYVSALILSLRSGAASLLRPLAAAGRMAFTNYLTQSLIMTSIFYGGRGALMGDVDRPALWAIVVAIWGLQLIWSPLWLSRFEMGPFEWAWRCLTYGRRVPLLKVA